MVRSSPCLIVLTSHVPDADACSGRARGCRRSLSASRAGKSSASAPASSAARSSRLAAGIVPQRPTGSAQRPAGSKRGVALKCQDGVLLGFDRRGHGSVARSGRHPGRRVRLRLRASSSARSPTALAARPPRRQYMCGQPGHRAQVPSRRPGPKQVAENFHRRSTAAAGGGLGSPVR